MRITLAYEQECWSALCTPSSDHELIHTETLQMHQLYSQTQFLLHEDQVHSLTLQSLGTL